jgi:hypothetical protein
MALVVGSGCSDDADDSAPSSGSDDAAGGSKSTAGNSAKGGTGGAKASSGGTGGAKADAAGSSSSATGNVECGSTSCSSPPGGFAMACCADADKGVCGVSLMGAQCSVPEPGDERCPGVDVMGFVMLPSCCTDNGMCGINPAMFGMPGCVELGDAAKRAQMTMASAFPSPRRCDGSAVGNTDSDAGMTDADAGL